MREETNAWMTVSASLLLMKGRSCEMRQNLALRGQAVQSSTYVAWSSFAIDGYSTSCTHTKTETNPWWRLELPNSFSIGRVVFINRIDCCPALIDGAQILIGDSLVNNGSSNSKCAEISGLSAGQSVSYSCGGLQGRYVIVFVPGDFKNLTVCELMVYSTGNVQLNGYAVQSSIYEYWHAQSGNDGIKFAPGQNSFCTHTKTNTNPWWILDLLDTYYVDFVTITNRADCCAERINGAEIHIGNSTENNTYNNPICAVISSMPLGASYRFSCAGMEGRYVSVVLPGVDRLLALCEVEVYQQLWVRKNSVKLKLVSSSDLTGPENDKLLSQLQSSLEVRGFTKLKLSWIKPPQPEVKRDQKGQCLTIP
ncbi:uncharacterized protein isoform X2 [Danio rerio]|uniref:Uncharacterized protein isoform X2 n=1 Tax=Danio rerio TaxID=7955 RepID=A0A8M9PKJ9_DANRE|nr:uncharacterized protein LOC100334521 isoform X2 [Danio rerio]|eukprot:XP_021327523.1 uncharacterized protein LOC100334521 isoform X2 [Danio rerio]